MKLLLLMVMSLALFAQDKKDDPVVAKVGETTIRKSTLLKYHAQNLGVVRANKKVTIESSLDDLVNRIIGIQRGKKNKLHKDPTVLKKMNDIIYHAQVSRDLEPQFKKIGKISDEQVMKYCKENPEFRTSQILLRLRTQPSKEDVESALKQSVVIYKEAKKTPEKFDELAKKYSQTNNSNIGGDLGFQPRTRLSPEFYEAIRGQAPGHITKPFRTQYGIHVVKVTDVKKCKDINKNFYKKIIYDTKRDKIIEDYFSGLRKEAKVKVYNDKL